MEESTTTATATATKGITPEMIEQYAWTYMRSYRINRQEALDYMRQIRGLIGKANAMTVLQRAMEISLKSYALS